MIRTRRSAHVAALLLTAIVFGAPAAFAQDSSEAERPPVRFGPFELWPSLMLNGVGVDANVYNDAENPKRDFTATVVPALQVIVRPPRVRLTYTTLSEFVYFRTYKDERHVNRRFSTSAEVDLAYVRPFASMTAVDNRERPNTEIDLRARLKDRRYSAGLRVPLGPVASVSIAASRGTNRYDPDEQFRGVDLATELNSETNGIGGTFSLAITPLTTIGLSVSSDHDRFEISTLRNSDSLRITPTISFSPAGYFSGSATVGWRRFDAADPSVGDYSGLTAGGTVGVVIGDRYHLETAFARDVRYSYEASRPTYVFTSARGTLRTVLVGGIDVKLLGGREVMNYRGLDGGGDAGRDTVVSYGFGLGYNVRDRIRIGVDAEFLERTSPDAARGYTNNRVLGTLVWGIRQQ